MVSETFQPLAWSIVCSMVLCYSPSSQAGKKMEEGTKLRLWLVKDNGSHTNTTVVLIVSKWSNIGPVWNMDFRDAMFNLKSKTLSLRSVGMSSPDSHLLVSPSPRGKLPPYHTYEFPNSYAMNAMMYLLRGTKGTASGADRLAPFTRQIWYHTWPWVQIPVFTTKSFAGLDIPPAYFREWGPLY